MVEGELQYSYIEDASSTPVRYKCAITCTFMGKHEKVTSGYCGTREAAKEEAVVEAVRMLRNKISGIQSRSRGASPGDSSDGEPGAVRELKQMMRERGLKEPKFQQTKSSKAYSYQYTVFAYKSGSVTGDVCSNREEARQSAARKMLEKLKKS